MARLLRMPGLLLLLVGLAGSTAWAGPREEAKVAYKNAVRAYFRGDYQEASLGFLRAYQATPRQSLLRKALKSAGLSNRSVLVMYLVSLVDAGPASRGLVRYAKRLERKHRGRVGQILVRCGSDPECSVRVRDKNLRDGQRAYLEVGDVEVEVTSHGSTQVRRVNIYSAKPTIVPPQKQSARSEQAPMNVADAGRR